ncbi:MAG: hypothetical protein JW782_03880 [Candidatus Saganbacteria bacterium]|nr:hypothetical protein [Candidatus Saganbacteria bacterium]
MSFVDIIHLLSIGLEAIAMYLGVRLASVKKKEYGWYIAITFAIWIFYDMINFLSRTNLLCCNIPQSVLYLFFFAAALSIVYAVWKIYQEA